MRRAEAQRKWYKKKVDTETPRGRRDRRRNERRRKQNSRTKIAFQNKEKQDMNSSALSEAAQKRESKKMKKSLLKVKRENLRLQRCNWKLNKRLIRKRKSDDTVKRSNEARSRSPNRMALKDLKSPKEARKALLAHYKLVQTLREGPMSKKFS